MVDIHKKELQSDEVVHRPEMPDHAIDEIQESVRARVFETVIEHEGQLPEEFQIQDDLRQEPKPVIAEIKEAAIKAREIVLEERRLIEVLKESLKRKLERLDSDEVPVEQRPMLRKEIPRLIAVLEGPREGLFKSGLNIDSYLQEINDHLRSISQTFELVDLSGVTRGIVQAEVDLAICVLEQSRTRPVLAHRVRGFSKDEASAEGLDAALRERVSEVEFDIRMSRDHQPIIHHNATLGSSANRPESVKDLTAVQLKTLSLKNGSHITDLKGFFEILRATGNESTKINIDIKDFDEQMLDSILSLIREYRMEHRVAIVSWFPQALQYLYEKDPSLSYSLSYYPILRGISRWIFNHIQATYGNAASQIPIVDRIATWVAATRSKAAESGSPKVLGTGSEIITNSIILDPNAHWTEIKEKAETGGQELVGRHTFAGGPAPERGSSMSRVLQHGSVNVMACEETLFSIIDHIPLPHKVKEWLLDLFRRKEAILAFAKECAEQGIKVNLFDLKNQGNIDEHFERFEAAGVSPGVVYSSNPDLVPRLVI